MIAGSGGHRLVHEAAIYGSTSEFLEVAVPFLSAGIEAGESTLLSLDADRVGLVLDAMDGHEALAVLDPGTDHDHPLSGLHRTRDLVAASLSDGGRGVRVLGEMPPVAPRRAWAGWATYEAMVNHLHADLPLLVLCPFDRRTTPAPMLDQVQRTHRVMVGPGDTREDSRRFVPPTPFLVDHARAAARLIEERPADLELTDPSLIRARYRLQALADGILDAMTAEAFVLAANEVLTNAFVHGRPPTRVRAWRTPTRLTVAVEDRGPGLHDPYAGVMPDAGTGHGLRLARQLCDQLFMVSGTDRFTVYLTTAGTG